jgi:hypothetical protein
MHRAVKIIAPLAIAAAITAAIVASTSSSARPATPDPPVGATDPYASPPSSSSSARVSASSPALASEIIAGRMVTSKYVTDLARAEADGYRIITRMIPNMGYHFMNPKVSGFDVRKPQILVYEHRGATWQLGALEWVFPSKPAKPPLPGAQYGVFAAACHYVDGTFVPQTVQAKCASKSPQTGAEFSFWHPRLIILHLWVWYPNPSGVFTGTNPLVAPFNNG